MTMLLHDMTFQSRGRRFTLIGLTMLAVAGCTVGPDFKPAQPTTMPTAWTPPPAPTTGPTTQESVTTETEPDVRRWWNVFNDAMLDSLIDRAVESNLDLKVAEARVREARASRGVVASALWPTVDTSAAYNRNGSGAPHARETDLYRAGLDAGWEIDVFGGVRRSVEAAEADIQTAIEDRRDVLVTLTAEVALDYFDLRSLQRRLQIANDNLKAQRYSYDLTQRRQRGGFVSSLDVVNAQAQVAATESQIPLLEQDMRQTIYAMSVLLGREPAALLEELSTVGPLPPVPPEVPVGLPSELLRRRPDIRRAESQLHSATARVGVATADLFPRFSLNGSLAFAAGEYKPLFNWSSSLWSFGPSMSWPLFDAGRIRANIAVQNAAQEQVYYTYQRTVLVALQEVENSLVAYSQEQRRRLALIDAVTASRRSVELSTELYGAGRTDFLNVLTAQRAMLSSEDALAQSDRTIATNLVAIFKALGGGWDETTEPR